MSTFNTIKGSEPYLLLSDGITKLSELDELMGFSMPKQDGSQGTEQIDITMASTAINIPKGMKYQDAVVLVTADGNLHNITGLKVGDDDGDATLDADAKLNVTVGGQMRATWYNGDTAIAASSLNQKISACGGPYTLKLEIPTNVTANTPYGNPSSKSYGTHTGITYTFEPTTEEICYLKPKDMTIYAGTGVKYSSGYNPAIWVADTGFSIPLMNDKGIVFPTTGFYKAQFDVLGSGGDQRNYRCSSTDNGGKITLSGSASSTLGANCTVTYNAETKSAFTLGGTPTINLQYYNGSSWETVDSYTIPIPDKWALSPGQLAFGNQNSLLTSTTFPTLDACRQLIDGNATPATTKEQILDVTDAGKAWRQKYLYRRNELTNSPLANPTQYPELSAQSAENYFSRDVGTFTSEWGFLYYYPGSIWELRTYYWTAELWSNRYPFEVGTHGYVYHDYASYRFAGAICRGE